MATAINVEHKLPSEKIYEEYSKRDGELFNDSKCSDLTIIFPEFPDIDKLCDRLLINLKHLNTIDKKDQSVIHDCKLLQYWMNDRVIKELSVTDYDPYIGRITKLYIAWTKIEKILNGDKYICKPTSGPLITLPVNDFIFRKEMYDYYYNYLKIKDREISTINACSETCKYLNSINDNYLKFKSVCSHSNDKCVPEYNKFVEHDLKHFIDQLGCNIESDCNEDKVLVPVEKSEETQSADVSKQDQIVGDNTQDSMKNSNRMNIVNVALPASVFFVLFPMLYKMTPLGSRFGKANKIRNNIINDMKNEEGEYFLTHPFEQESMNNADKTYNISYNNT